MNIQKEYEYFGYVGKRITDAYCADSGIHQEFYERGLKGFMMSFTNSLDTFRSVCIKEIVTEKGSLDRVLAHYSAIELRNMGLPLPAGFETQHILELNTSYILNSTLCWVAIETKKGTNSFFATKNPHMLTALSSHFAETESKKRLVNFQPQLTNTYNELNTGIFEAVTLSNDNGGLRLGKAKINCNAKGTIITTMYSLGNFIDSVSNYLGKNKTLIVYTENGEEKNLVTTLIPAVLEKWIGAKHKNTISNIIDNSQNPFVYGELVLPNLYKRNDFVNLHVLSIKSIRSFE